MRIQYLVDKRCTGRTTEVLKAFVRDREKGMNAYFLTLTLRDRICAVNQVGRKYDHWIIEPLDRQSFRGRELDVVYIDDADNMEQEVLNDCIRYLQPQVVVMVVCGEPYKRCSQ